MKSLLDVFGRPIISILSELLILPKIIFREKRDNWHQMLKFDSSGSVSTVNVNKKAKPI